MTETKYNYGKKQEQAIVKEVIERLEMAIELNKQGKVEEGDKAIDDTKKWLESMINGLEAQRKPDGTPIIDCIVFPQNGEMFAEGERVILGVIKEDEKEKYLAVSFEYNLIKEVYKDESFRETIWEEFISENAFVCSIYDKESGEYVGYCSIKNLAKNDWELAIELKSDECHKGYGTEALKIFMEAVKRLTGRGFFRVRVEIDNYASQGLMKKLGATPNGVSEFLIHGKEIEKFQEEHKEMITDEIRKVAADFCMEAEDILGYVLEYRLEV